MTEATKSMDPYFRVEVLRKYPLPQSVVWQDMHQCYSEGYVHDESVPPETKAGELIVKHLLKGGRGHYGPLENPQITLNVGWFPHSTMQQVRTHRVGVHFSVQSFRYSGRRIADVVELGSGAVEQVFYLRPVGEYCDRQGKKYVYTHAQRTDDIAYCYEACQRYKARIDDGFSEEHARGLIPFDVRQHWVMSANVRSLMHLLDMRMQKSAQLEAQQLCELIWPHFEEWVPEVAAWYEKTRQWRPRLAP